MNILLLSSSRYWVYKKSTCTLQRTSSHMTSPYKKNSMNIIYNLLFCDKLELHTGTNKPSEYPWSAILSNVPNPQQLMKVSQDANVESRLRLLAYWRLRNMNQPIITDELLGVIIEVRLEKGLDTLAAYQDGRARYINQSEALIVYEKQTDTSDKIIRDLFKASQNVVDRIGPWNKERRPAPELGMCRLSFLVAGQLYFGEGSFGTLSTDAMAGPVISAAFKLLRFLIAAALTESAPKPNLE